MAAPTVGTDVGAANGGMFRFPLPAPAAKGLAALRRDGAAAPDSIVGGADTAIIHYPLSIVHLKLSTPNKRNRPGGRFLLFGNT